DPSPFLKAPLRAPTKAKGSPPSTRLVHSDGINRPRVRSRFRGGGAGSLPAGTNRQEASPGDKATRAAPAWGGRAGRLISWQRACALPSVLRYFAEQRMLHIRSFAAQPQFPPDFLGAGA